MAVDPTWHDAVREACEPVFASADVGFVWNQATFDAAQPTLLWEADPERFAARYPDSGIERSYGDQVAASLHRLLGVRRPRDARGSALGRGLERLGAHLRAERRWWPDGQLLATAFAAILRVP